MPAMLKHDRIARLFNSFKSTPLHPQWFVFRKENKNLNEIAGLLSGRILDIGCGEKLIKNKITDNCEYVGLDYYKTATEWYESTPEVFGDAHTLSFPDKSFDCVLLLDVMEHLPDPGKCLDEVNRVLSDTGIFIIFVPFLYPIHDSPLDFRRWTIYGLRQLTDKHGFTISEEKHDGNILETAGLLLNIAISKTILNWIHKKNPAAILILLLPFMVLTINFFVWIVNCISPEDSMMPTGYRIILKKK